MFISIRRISFPFKTDGSPTNVFSDKYEGCVRIELDGEEDKPGFWHDVGCYGYTDGYFCQIPLGRLTLDLLEVHLRVYLWIREL